MPKMGKQDYKSTRHLSHRKKKIEAILYINDGLRYMINEDLPEVFSLL